MAKHRPLLGIVVVFACLCALAASAFAGAITVARGTDAVTLDAHMIQDSPSAAISSHISETLFRLTEEGEIVPYLAESYEVDGLEWRFQIRQGISFTDGTPLNAEAVAYNLERFRTEGTFAFLLGEVESVEAVDEYTVKVTTRSPFAPLLPHLTHSSIGIMSPAAIERLGDDLATNPVGTGPYRLEEWIPSDRVVLVRNEDYWGELPPTERIIFRQIPEESGRAAAVLAGEAHVAERILPHDAQFIASAGGVRVIESPSVRSIYIGLNSYQKEGAPPNPFADRRVRQAVNYAIDKEAIVEFILNGIGRPVDAPITPGIFGYTPVRRYEYDPDRARRLLAEAGYPNGFQTRLYSPVGRYLNDIQITEAIQAQLSEVGIDAQIVTMEWAAYLEATGRGPEESEAPMFMLGWGTVTGDADYGLYPLFHRGEWAPAGFNRAFYDNPEVNRLLEIGRTDPDPDVRLQAYAEAMELIMEDAPWIFLHGESQLTAVREEVEGVIIHVTERVLLHEASLR